jgi:hypothetical protein
LTQKKSYSRYFIILQEDEKGYALASDKLPSGYTKLEIKNDKCKVSYYVQNLKKESAPYYMVLICNKKDVKKLLRIGELNIDEHGRAEIAHEYPVENIANCGVNVDKVIGAAVVRFMNSNIMPVMSGFASNDVPEWRSFPVVESELQRNDKIAPQVVEEKPQVSPESNLEVKAEDIQEEPIKEYKEEPKNIFDEYEEKIEQEKSKTEVLEQVEKLTKEMPRNEEEIKTEEKVEIEIDAEDDRKKKKYKDNECPVKMEDECDHKKKEKEEHYKEEKCEKHEHHKEEKCEKHEHHKEENCEKDAHDKKCKNDKPKGSVGTFFMDVADGFEELHGICGEIKRCSWYKVPAYHVEDMVSCADHNKYTVAYQPMVNHHQYICRYGHFILGYKLDKENKMKYLVYGIPGTKSRSDQPYGGRSGFVTWVPLVEGKEEDHDYGYWLMFYDFRKSTIVIPVK